MEYVKIECKKKRIETLYNDYLNHKKDLRLVRGEIGLSNPNYPDIEKRITEIKTKIAHIEKVATGTTLAFSSDEISKTDFIRLDIMRRLMVRV